MTIHLRERPHASAASPSFARLGWGVTFVAVCLVGLGGGARLLMEPTSNSPSPTRTAEHAARKKPVARSAANAPAPAAPARAVRVIPTDPTPVASISPPPPQPGTVAIRASRPAFGEMQRAIGSAYQGFRIVAGP